MQTTTTNTIETELRALAAATEAEGTFPSPALSAEEWRPGEGRDDDPTHTAPAGLAANGDHTHGAAATSAAKAEEASSETNKEMARRAEEFQREWQRHAAEEANVTPELQESQSALRQAVERILAERPLLATLPDGFRHAAAIARAEAKASAAAELEARLAKLTQENERLARLTSITGSGPTRTSGGTDERTESELRRMAREYDAGGGDAE